MLNVLLLLYWTIAAYAAYVTISMSWLDVMMQRTMLYNVIEHCI